MKNIVRYQMKRKNESCFSGRSNFGIVNVNMKKLWQSILDWRIFSSFWRNHIWYEHVSSRLRPRNKWLTTQIPRTWVDKDTILEIVVLESLKHYCDVDGEDCFHIIDTECESQREFYGEVKRQYELTTQKLVTMQKELDAAWEAVPHRTLADINKSTKDDYEQMYGKIDRLEKEIYDLQTEIMVWVVKNRNGLWT